MHREKFTVACAGPMPWVKVGSKEVYLLPQHDACVFDFAIIAGIAPVPLGLPKTLSWCTWAQARLDRVEKITRIAGISRLKL